MFVSEEPVAADEDGGDSAKCAGSLTGGTIALTLEVLPASS